MNDAEPLKIRYEVYPEGDLFVARCLDIPVSSDGATDEEALANLNEAVQLYAERNAEAFIRKLESGN